MHLFIEKGIRGGLSYITIRYSKANNRYVQPYDANKPSKCVKYLNANKLYGWPMSQYLSYGRFKWLSQKETDKLPLNLIGCIFIEENSFDGYILEVDLEYPDKLHELYGDYPLAPEKFEISDHVLSNYCNSIANEYNIKIGGANKLGKFQI